MRILHVLQSLDPAWGGIARVVPELATELSAAGFPSRVAALSGGRFGAAPTLDGVDLRTFEANGGRNPLGRSDAFDAAIDGLVGEADLVHLHGLWTGQNWTVGKAARRRGKPTIMTPHSMMMPWAWKRSWWKKRPIGWLFEHRNLREAARLHALAEAEARAIAELGFNTRIETIPNGLRTAEFATLPLADALFGRFPVLRDRRLLLMLGRIHPQKGIVQGMQACFDTLAAGKEWHLVVAGPDELGLRPMLEAAITRKGLKDRVTFTGMLPREEVLALLGRTSLLLQPSLSEGLSMSILEALAAGVPVVISVGCNMPEVGTSGAGMIVGADRRQIAAALKSIVGKGEVELREMGRRGQELAKSRYDWSAVIPRYTRMYEEVLSGKQGG